MEECWTSVFYRSWNNQSDFRVLFLADPANIDVVYAIFIYGGKSSSIKRGLTVFNIPGCQNQQHEEVLRTKEKKAERHFRNLKEQRKAYLDLGNRLHLIEIKILAVTDIACGPNQH